MRLEEIVPWGRSLAEYRKMFSLSDADLEGTILGCGDGPASFNAELTAAGGSVISIDPIYEFDSFNLERRIHEVRADILQQMRRQSEDFVWETIASVEELEATRMRAMGSFLTDFESGKAAKRYQAQSLPKLNFDDKRFDLALCSHFLFLYSDQLGLETHLESLLELCRVAGEVRIFPLLALNGEESPHLTQAIATLCFNGYDVQLEQVDYEFQRGANEMMVIQAS